MIPGLDHLQISIPASGLAETLSFCIEVPGVERIANRAGLELRGARLVQDDAPVQLGEATPFATDGCACSALRVANSDAIFNPLTFRAQRRRDEVDPEGCRRVSVSGLFGDRTELMQSPPQSLLNEEALGEM